MNRSARNTVFSVLMGISAFVVILQGLREAPSRCSVELGQRYPMVSCEVADLLDPVLAHVHRRNVCREHLRDLAAGREHRARGGGLVERG